MIFSWFSKSKKSDIQKDWEIIRSPNDLENETKTLDKKLNNNDDQEYVYHQQEFVDHQQYGTIENEEGELGDISDEISEENDWNDHEGENKENNEIEVSKIKK